jgi:tetratricopeptide (TPR) repeat protein
MQAFQAFDPGSNPGGSTPSRASASAVGRFKSSRARPTVAPLAGGTGLAPDDIAAQKPPKRPPRLRTAIAIFGKPGDEKNKALLEHFAAGLTHAREARHEEALTEFDFVVRAAPANPDGWHNKGTQLIILGRFSEALAAFNVSVNLQPEDSDSWDGQATCLGELGRLDDSLIAIDRALRRGMNNPDFWHNRGQAHFALGHYRQAFESYDKALAMDRNRASTWAARAAALGKMMRASDELVAVAELVRLEPTVARWRRRQIELLSELKRDAEAKAARLEMYRAFKDDPEVQFEHGSRLAGRGKDDKAEVCFSEAARLAPDKREPLLELGRCQARLGKHAEALAAAEELLRRDHNDADAALLGARALAALGRLRDAITVAEIAARTQRTSGEAWTLLSDLGKRAERPDIIERAMRGTLAIDRRDIASLHDLAVALGRQGKTKAALGVFDEALRRAPHEPELLYAKGVFAQAQGRFKQARALYLLALREKPDMAKALERKAEIDKKLHGGAMPKAAAPDGTPRAERPRGARGGNRGPGRGRPDRGRPDRGRPDRGRPRGAGPEGGARDDRGPGDRGRPRSRGPRRDGPGDPRPRGPGGRGPGGRGLDGPARGGGGGKGGKGPNAQGGVARGTNKQGGQDKARNEPKEKGWLEVKRPRPFPKPEPPQATPKSAEPESGDSDFPKPTLSIRERRALRRPPPGAPQETAKDGGRESG